MAQAQQSDPYAEFGGKTISDSSSDPYAAFGGQITQPQTGADFAPPNPSPTGTQNPLIQAGANFLGGVGASVYKPISTIYGAAEAPLENLGMSPQTYERGRQKLEELSTPPPTLGGKLGNVAGETAQYFIPARAEEAGARAIAGRLPELPMIARRVATAIPAAAGTGVINKLQGGSFTGGAALGLAGGAALAPELRSSAELEKAGTRGLTRALEIKGGKAGVKGASLESDIEVAKPHLAKIARGKVLSPQSILQRVEHTGPPQWFEDTAQAIDNYQKGMWEQYHSIPLERNAGQPFPWDKVKQQALTEISPEDDSLAAQSARNWIDREIPKLKTLGSADRKVRLLNQEIKSTPEAYGPVRIRVMMAAQKAIRSNIDTELEELGERGVLKSNHEWGALQNIKDRLMERYYQEEGKAAKSSPVPEWAHAYIFGGPGHVAYGLGVRASSILKPNATRELSKGLKGLAKSGLEPEAPPAWRLAHPVGITPPLPNVGGQPEQIPFDYE